ncbi:FecR family protein [Shinella sp. BYT-45]|uniref:FecR family protein n=1 Tax=Shinella sp. BYT-45 TaxID=3377377 RepID=UPI00397FDDA4
MERDKPERSDEEEGFVHPDPVMDAALNWLFLLQADPQDAALRAAFETWHGADPAHARTFAAVAGAWDLPEMDTVARTIASRIGYTTHAGDAPVVRYRRPKRNIAARVALAAAAAVILAIGIQRYPLLMVQWQADYVTATGVRDEITLPDGSRMTLNTASAVSVDFEGTKRSIALLQGEAYFDVAHDPARPFTVAAAFSEVEVKGTAFSVRTDSDADTVVLERGHVDVARLPERKDTASLEAGESITASAETLSAVRKTDTAASLAWLQGRLVFEDQPFGRVIGEVGRYYGQPVIVANGALRGIRINGSYRVDDPERVIRSLATAAGASVTRIPGGLLILR